MRVKAYRTVVLLGLLPWLAAASVSTSWNEDQYLIRTWRVGDGLPFNRIEDVIQRKNGFVWVATQNGAARFDGVGFERFDTRTVDGLPDNQILKLHESASGILLLGHGSGHVSARYGNVFHTLPCPPEWNEVPVTGFVEDAEGSVWAVNARGGRLQIIQTGELLDEPVKAERDSDAVNSGWVVRDDRVVRLDQAVVVEDWGETPWIIKDQTIVLCALANGDVAGGTEHGGIFIMRHKDREVIQITVAEGLASSTVTSLAEDAEGLLWVGTISGLQVIRPVDFEPTDFEGDQWQFRAVRSITPRKAGGVWVGTSKGNVWIHDAGGLRRLWPELYGETVRRMIHEDRKGNLWINDDEGFLIRLTGKKMLRIAADGADGERLWTMHEHADGRLWVGGDTGVWMRGDKGRWGRVIGSKRGIEAVRCLAGGEDGVVWIGMDGGGLAALQDNRVTRYGLAEGLPNLHVTAIETDCRDGALWIGTCGSGVVRYHDGRFENIPFAQKIISGITDDGEGRLWIVGEQGVSIVSKTELLKGEGAVERYILFGKDDGVEPPIDIDVGLSTSCRTGDGRFWFAANRQLVAFNSPEIRILKKQVPLQFTHAVVNKSTQALEEQGSMVFDPGVNRLDISFAALSHVNPARLRYRCRLVGLDGEWIDLGNRRTATFQRLPPGHYRFELLASNRDGIWNPDPAMLAFTIKPFFWETWWFKTLVYALGVAVVAFISLGIAERINRKKLILVEKAKAVEQERTRIAMDIHDEIGSELTRMQLLCHRVRKSVLPKGDEAPPPLIDMERVVGKLVLSLDEIVWVVCPGNDNVDNLLGYLAKYVSNYLRTTDIRPEINLPLSLPRNPVPGPARHNLFLAVKEALNNIVKHSGAKQVVFAASFEGDKLKVRLEDDGKGLESLEGERFKRGLRSMRRRMALVGGKCDIRNNEACGATAEFTMPIKEMTE